MPDSTADIEITIEEADLEYLLAGIPVLLEDTMSGVERISNIVHSTRNYAHPGSNDAYATVDINEVIRTAINFSRSSWKHVAEVLLNLDESIPPVQGNPSELDQVLLNLIVNASHSIAEKKGDSAEKGVLTVRSSLEEGRVVIKVSDTGKGIPDKVKEGW